SARWLARFNLGLHQILTSLMKGDEVTADDSTLLKMTEIAIHCAAHVKAILGFTIPHDCKPIWLLATLLEQLGLKLTFRKQGKRGQQVKLFSLSKEELEFALQVIAHRVEKRNQKENRTYYAAQTPAAYSVNPNQQAVSTPPPNAIGNSHCQGEDTTDESRGAEEQRSRGVEELRNKEEICTSSFPSAPLPPCPSALFTDRVTLLHCVEILRSGIKQGVDAIKGILKRWVEDLRWETVLELEAIAASELRLVEAQIPEFYALLSEEVLPVEG
ncbi:bifunctional DNA primase/helicase, partial [Nostoc sp. UHCC 0252]|nr:bifunctional DNA primase/helicase [Nostoc sp. UHCC 0252]